MSTAPARVSIDDLLFAQDWLETYDGAPDDENNAAAQRVAAWLQAEITRRENDITFRRFCRAIAEKHGGNPGDKAVRGAARRHMARLVDTDN